ncbi:MAG: hypothetical protein U9N73_05825 [Candidatus Auribacterota bacterium]|nr:hypothetical protein [Candidatus Auribacterota bacterium]
MKKSMSWKIISGIFIPLLFLSCARSTVLLRGNDAEEYLAGENHLIAPGYYTFGEVRNRQSNVLMTAIFNRDHGEEDDGNIKFLRREKSMGYRHSSNPYNSVLLNSPDGKRGSEPTSENLEDIRKSNLLPVIVINSAGEEEAVVYRPAGERVTAFEKEGNNIRVEIGQRSLAQGDMAYYIGFKNVLKIQKDSPEKWEKKKEKEIMNDINIGDLVQWESGSKPRVGVVKEVNQDGTALINIPTTEGSREEKIRTERLEVITSTISND